MSKKKEKTKKEYRFDEIFKPPFITDGMCFVYAQGDYDITCLDFDARSFDDFETVKKVVATMNGGTGHNLAVDYVKRDNQEFGINGLKFTVRGWGYLTGSGAKRLSDENAAKIQDDFMDWIIKLFSNDGD